MSATLLARLARTTGLAQHAGLPAEQKWGGSRRLSVSMVGTISSARILEPQGLTLACH